MVHAYQLYQLLESIHKPTRTNCQNWVLVAGIEMKQGRPAQDSEIVVSSQPHGAMRVALFASLKIKNTVPAANTIISGIIKFSAPSMTGVTPHPIFVAR